MAVGQKLRGAVGQGMAGRKETRRSYCQVCGPGSYAFKAPFSGRYKFVLHGAGGAAVGGVGGASGAYAEKTLPLVAGQVATITVGAARSAVSTSVSLPGWPMVVAGSANGTTPGTATGCDFGLSGSAGGIAGVAGNVGSGLGGGSGGAPGSGRGGGAGAPGTIEFPGGGGQDAEVANDTGTTPGGGQAESLGALGPGGDGRAVVFLAKF